LLTQRLGDNAVVSINDEEDADDIAVPGVISKTSQHQRRFERITTPALKWAS
jgi:hypothetical protein